MTKKKTIDARYSCRYRKFWLYYSYYYFYIIRKQLKALVSLIAQRCFIRLYKYNSFDFINIILKSKLQKFKYTMYLIAIIYDPTFNTQFSIYKENE